MSDVRLLRDRDRNGFDEVYYLDDLSAINNNAETLVGKYELMRDLDFNDPDSYLAGEINPDWTVADFGSTTDTGWVSIGNATTPFTGEFEGHGYVIYGLQINQDTEDSQGLFGNIGAGGAVRNLGLPNVRIEGGTQVGAVVGSHSGKIANSYATGTISAVGSVGGIAGNASGSGVIVNSRSSVRVSATGSSAGGMIGICSNCTVFNSFAVGSVDGVGSSANNIGGFIGELRSSSFDIGNNYAWGNVSGGRSMIGGGSNGNGGFFGYTNIDGGRLNANYSIGRTDGTFDGNINAAVSALPSVTAPNYWNQDTAPATAAFDRRYQSSRRTTLQLQAGIAQSDDENEVYYNWDNADWDFGNAMQYPLLKYTAATDALGGAACRNAADAPSQIPVCGTLVAPGLRYGLRSLTTRHAQLSPPFDASGRSIGGVYFGTVQNDSPWIQLIATAFDATATYSVYVGGSQTPLYTGIASGEASGEIALSSDDITEVVVEVQGTGTARYTLYLDYERIATIDADHDGLVDLNYLEDIAMLGFNFRRDDNGGITEIGYRETADDELITVGCPGVCRGYELTRDLDFTDPADYRDPAENEVMSRWTGQGWDAVGIENAIFDGNGYTISGLKVSGNTTNNSAFFHTVIDSEIDGLGLLGVDIGGADVAGLVVRCADGCELSNSYVIGQIKASRSAFGLVGHLAGNITNSYFIGTIEVEDDGNFAAGLAGVGGRDLSIANSRVIGRIIAPSAAEVGMIAHLLSDTASLELSDSFADVLATKGGEPQGVLVSGSGSSTSITTSYFDSDIASVASPAGVAQSTAELRSETMPSGIFADWDAADWDFGTSEVYPAIKYNSERCRSGLRSERCGRILRYQGSMIEDFRLSGDAGFKLPFDFATFNQEIVRGFDQSSLQFTAVAFNPNARIVVYRGARVVAEVASGAMTPPIALNTSGETILDVVVVDSEERSSYRYRFRVSVLQTSMIVPSQNRRRRRRIHRYIYPRRVGCDTP